MTVKTAKQKQSRSFLRRYTNLPAVLHMLATRQITLLDPKTWDDRNDAYYLEQYKKRRELKTVLALCFSQDPETYHHWRVFSEGPAGVCVVFHRDRLLKKLRAIDGVTTDEVHYRTLSQSRKAKFKVDQLPFLKRAGFRPESEFRAIYESSSNEVNHLDVPIELSCIDYVSLSPWLPFSLKDSLVNALRTIEGCKKLRVSRSTLISNEEWKSFAQHAV
jgi:hypothetical protein